MIGLKCRAKLDVKKIRRRVDQGNFRSLAHAAATIRLVARRSIRQRKDPKLHSPIGSPPFTHTKRLRNAIMYAVDRFRTRAVIGPAKRIVGTSGAAHEFGGEYKGRRYPKRPFMGPALMKVRHRLPRKWRNSVR